MKKNNTDFSRRKVQGEDYKRSSRSVGQFEKSPEEARAITESEKRQKEINIKRL